MARLEYFIVCRAVSVDIDSDEITMSQVIEDAFPQEFPEHLPKIMAVSSWELTVEELQTDFQAQVKIVIPGSSDGPTFPMNLHRGRRRIRAIHGVLQIPLPCPGDLTFELLLNGRHGATHVVTVHPPGVRGLDTSGNPLHMERLAR